MNDTEAGASRAGCRRSDAPKTCPASICRRLSRLRSASDWDPAGTGIAKRHTSASAPALLKRLAVIERPLSASSRGVIELVIGPRHDEQLRADLEPRALGGLV